MGCLAAGIRTNPQPVVCLVVRLVVRIPPNLGPLSTAPGAYSSGATRLPAMRRRHPGPTQLGWDLSVCTTYCQRPSCILPGAQFPRCCSRTTHVGAPECTNRHAYVRYPPSRIVSNCALHLGPVGACRQFPSEENQVARWRRAGRCGGSLNVAEVRTV